MIWWNEARLEGHSGKLAEEGDQLFVIAGPAFLPQAEGIVEFPVIGEVAVPTHFFRNLVRRGEVIEAWAFLIPNQGPFSEDFRVYLTSIENLEEITGLDFLPNLESKYAHIEARVPERIRSYYVWSARSRIYHETGNWGSAPPFLPFFFFLRITHHDDDIYSAEKRKSVVATRHPVVSPSFRL